MALREASAEAAGSRVIPPAGGVQPTLRADAGTVFAVFAAFAFFAFLSWQSFGSGGGPSFFYPAAGVTAAAMMLSRRALWPWIAAAVVAAEVLVDSIFGNPLWLSAAFAAANVVEPVIGASLVLACCRGRPDLRRRRDYLVFIVGACVIAPVFGAIIGGTASSASAGMRWLGATVTWWGGDALGVLVMASPILLWKLQVGVIRRRPWQLALAVAAAGLITVATFWTDFPPTVLILPVLAWAGFRLNMLGAAIAGAVTAFLANIVATHSDRGLYVDVHASPEAKVTLTQITVAVIVVVAMLIAQEAAARASAVRKHQAERRERLRLETLSRLARQLSAALTPRDIGRALEDEVLSEAGAQALTMALVSDDGRDLNCIAMSGFPDAFVSRYGTRIPLSQRSVGTDVVRTRTPIEIDTFGEYAETYPDMAPLVRPSGDWSIVGWPLSTGGDPIGALVLTWADSEPLDPAQRAFVSAVATMVSQALVRSKLYVDEHARAMVLHSVAQPVTPVEVDGLEYRALYRPADAAHSLGGDWYSVMALPDRRTYLCVGDVIGHGLMSVEDMAQLRSAGNAFAHQGLSPAQILTELNLFSVHQIRGEFASNLVAIFDPQSLTVAFSSAGHPPALLRRAGTGEVIRLSGARGPVLGPLADTDYSDSVITVGDGDILVMYTDGLVEHDTLNVDAGIDRLQQVVASWPSDALLDCDALADHVAPAPQSDDICLLVVRFGTPKSP